MSEQNVNQRVNKVTVSLEGDGAKISLYRTNTRLGELTNADIGVPSFADSKLPNKQVYTNYCRETVVNLLNNGGVDGYYYDPNNHANTGGLPRKFDKVLLVKHGRDMVFDTINSTVENLAGVEVEIPDSEEYIEAHVSDVYKDGYIKYGHADFGLKINYNGNGKDITVPINIKSGQLCKPKIMVCDGTEKNINATNIIGLFGETRPVVSSQGKPIVVLQDGTQAVPSTYKPKEGIPQQCIDAECDGDHISIPPAPVNQEFEGDKPVVEDPIEESRVEASATAEPEVDNDIMSMMKAMGKGTLTNDDIQKLKDTINNNKSSAIDGKVGNIMNLLKGDRHE